MLKEKPLLLEYTTLLKDLSVFSLNRAAKNYLFFFFFVQVGFIFNFRE